MKRMTLIFILLLCICLLAGCGCRHEWEEATCTSAKICRLCEKTAGEPLEHSWVEANCAEPKHCTLCNLTEGKALGHQWSALTCAEEYLCTVCNAASGVKGPHVDVKNITQDADNNLLVQCQCGNEEILTIEELMLQLLQGKWSLRAVQKENSLLQPNPKEYWEEGTWLEIPSAEKPVAYQVGNTNQNEKFAFEQKLQDFQLTQAALYANGPQLPVLMCTARTDYSEELYAEATLILVFGQRDYAKQEMRDDEFINAAFQGVATSLWCHSDGIMYIYGYDIG